MRFCTYCGAAIREGMRFCGNCGTPVSEPVVAPVEPVQESAPVEVPVPVQEPVAPPPTVEVPVQTFVPPAQPVQPVYTCGMQPPAEQPKKKNPMALIGMLLGFLSVPNVLFSPVFAILAVIFSSIGISKSGKCGKKGLGMAITGLVLGILFLLLYFFIAPLRTAFWQDFYGGMFGDLFGNDLLDEFLYNFDIGDL